MRALSSLMRKACHCSIKVGNFVGYFQISLWYQCDELLSHFEDFSFPGLVGIYAGNESGDILRKTPV